MWKAGKKQQSYKENVVNTLKLPKDVCMGASVVTITGNKEAWIENYKGILDYSDKQIKLQAKGYTICFCGKCLTIDYYTGEDMKISGYIQTVLYDA